MNTKMILFLSPLPPPFYGSAMSSQTCLNVLKNSSKYNVKNIKVNYSQAFADIEKFTLRKIAGYFIGLFRIIHYSLKYKPQLVYIMPATSGFAFYRDFSYALAAKLFNHNIVYHLRTQITEKEKKSKLRKYLFRKAFKNSRVIVLGKELKKDINPYFTSDDTYILPNAITGTLSEDKYLQIEKNRAASKKLRLVFISNMIKSKGWIKTIHAANLLKQQGVDFKLRLAGSWPSEIEERKFYSLLHKYELSDQIEYLGHINDEQRREVLSTSDVMVFPTEYEYEALPRVIIEAYEYGIPVVSTQNGAIPSMIIHGQTGYMLKEYTPREIADYVVKLSDKTKSAEMGRNARNRFISHYEESVFARNFHEIIDDVINTSFSQKFEEVLEA